MDFSPKALRTRKDELDKQAGAIESRLQPLRDELDAIVAGTADLSLKEARAREDRIRPQIKDLQSKLYPIDMERAVVARALGSRTSPAE